MPSSVPFIGSGLSLESVSVVNNSVLRIKFTSDPLATSSVGVHDALNPANYALSGPGMGAVTAVVPTVGDGQTFSLVIASPLIIGLWTLSVSNIQTVSAVPLTPPTSLSFLIDAQGNATPLTGGTTNDDAAALLRKDLNPMLHGKNWTALIAAVATGDQTNFDNAALASDQLHIISARAQYLDRLTANEGLIRSTLVGIDDDTWRNLAIKIKTKKVVIEAVREVLDVYYGRDALRAFAQTANNAPFSLSNGQTLEFTLDEDAGKHYEITFSSEQFSNMAQATADEVASVITYNLFSNGSKGFAVAYEDPTTGFEHVRIYSGSLGLKSFVRITGGTSQNILRFPTYREVYSGSGTGLNWVYTLPTPGHTRITLTTTGIPVVNLTTVQADDYLLIGLDAGSVPGIYTIENVSFTWSGANFIQVVDLDENIGFVGTASQGSNDSYRFFVPTKRDTLQGKNTVVVSQTISGEIDVVLPATTAVVNRGPMLAAYGRENAPISVARLVRDANGLVTVDTNVPHGLALNGQVLIENYEPALSIPWVSLASGANTNGSYVSSFGTTSATAAVVPVRSKVAQLANGDLFAVGGQVYPSALQVKTALRFRLGVAGTVSDGSEATGSTDWAYTLPSTSSMSIERVFHAMTLMTDIGHAGFPFVTGGFSTAAELQSTEYYNPVANTWTSTANMAITRQGHAQITLTDGRILVCGGFSSADATTETEIYDPVANVWTVVTAMKHKRMHHSLVLLPDGKVLAISGIDNVAGPPFNTNTCEIYDPIGNTWTLTAKINTPRNRYSIVTLPNGLVFVNGGLATDDTTNLRSSEIFDPNSKRWYPGGQSIYARSGHFAILLPNKNKLVLIGNQTQSVTSDSNQVEYFDLSTFKYSDAPVRGGGKTAWAGLAGNSILVAGGNITTSFSSLDTFVPAADTVCGAEINGMHRVINVVSSTRFQFQSNVKAYTSNFGSVLGGGAVTDGGSPPTYINYQYWYNATSGTRTGNVTTLTVNFQGTPNVTIGEKIYVNLGNVNFGNGIFTVASVTATTIQYSETAANIGATSLNGGVSLNAAPDLEETVVAAEALTSTDMGPYVFDPDAGLPVITTKNPSNGAEIGLTTAISKNTQNANMAVDTEVPFNDAGGWLVIGFGTALQSKPIRYFAKSGVGLLLIDFEYVAEFNWPIGTIVTKLVDRAPQTPPVGFGSFYITGSAAGRVAAQSTIEDITATGFDLNIKVVYPGDRGLGGEGLPTSGDGKLSDAVEIWGPDES